MGSELAQAFRRLGSEVDLVHSKNNLLPKDEPEAGEVLRCQFEREGVRLHFGFKAVRAANGRLTVRSQSETRELEYDKLLLGIGRKANPRRPGAGGRGNTSKRWGRGGRCVPADEQPGRLRRGRRCLPGKVHARGDGDGALVRC